MVRQKEFEELQERVRALEDRAESQSGQIGELLRRMEALDDAPAETEEEKRRREKLERQFAALFAYDGKKKAGDE